MLNINKKTEEIADSSRKISLWLAIIVIAAGLAVLIGWILDIPAIKSIHPSLVSMKANTAFCFLLTGISMWLLQIKSQETVVSVSNIRIVRFFAVIIFFTGLLTIIEYIFKLNLGLDQLLLTEPAGTIRTTNPGRMSLITAVNFSLIGLSLFFIDLRIRHGLYPAQSLILIAEVFSLLSFLGYIYEVDVLYGSLKYTAMALHTSVLFNIICVAFLLARPQSGFMRLITSRNIGGVVFRRVSGFTGITLLILGWLRAKGETGNWYHSDFGTAVFTVVDIYIFAILLWFLSRILNKIDAENKDFNEELEHSRRLETIGTLAGGIAHDFNNVISGILGNISILRSGMSQEKEEYTILANVEQAALKAKGLTRQLLTFSKGGDPMKKVLLLMPLIKEAVALSLKNPKIKCDYNIEPDLNCILVDAGQFMQVLNNIIANAKQAMPEGGQLVFSAENIKMEENPALGLKAGPYVSLTITDTGPGIPSENIAKVFEPYFTTKSGGSGLGLTLCYSIIKKHNGILSVKSEPGSGASFIIKLPAVLAKNEEELPNTGKVLFKGSGRMLILDDEEIVLVMGKRLFGKLGYKVECFEDSNKAVDRYIQTTGGPEAFSVVLLDLIIPGFIDGKEVIKQLKAVNPEIKAIVSSGYSDDPVMSKFREYGFMEVLPKPFTLEEASAVLYRLEITK